MFDLLSKSNFSFQNKEFLWLLLLIPPLVALYWWRERNGRVASLAFSSVAQAFQTRQGWVKEARHAVFAMRVVALILLVLALARPVLENQKQVLYAEGIDIMLVMDLSGSMLAEDFEPKNRMEAAKEVAQEFVRKRVSDRIGLVVFAGRSFTQCPLTLDYPLLLSMLNSLRAGSMQEDGTAIGMAIATAVNRLRTSNAKSRIIVLLTDGQNNAGEIEPVTAAELAAALGIKIYAVGAGTQGYANYPIIDPIFGKRYIRQKVDVDDATLQRIADITGGKYFRATDYESLRRIYDEIDRLEKTKIETETYAEYKEEFASFLVPALLLLGLEWLLANTRFRKIP
ncbi:MAG: VWA domain-containing protein [Chloroherpetonaceae bacterium]|nr:VWA domain-containing protein [Chloroherpetonaceae bacterium]MDW8437425.1 VWA domain-containing protein [Chloroherpetonaceae bacterium]